MKERFSFGVKLYATVVIIIIFNIVIALVSNYYNQKRIETSSLVDHTNEVLREAEHILSLAIDLDGGGRAYVILSDSNYLEHLIRATKALPDDLKKIKELTIDNPAQQTRIDTLSKLIDRRIQFSLGIVRVKNEKGFEAAKALMATGQGRFYSNRIRALLSEIKNEELQLMDLRQRENNERINQFNNLFIILLVSMSFLVIFIGFMLRRNVLNRRRAAKAVEEERAILRTLVDNIPLNVYVKDLKSRKTLVNIQEMRYLGVTDEKELLGKDDFELYPSESALQSIEEDQQIFKTGIPIIDKETYNFKNDGTYAWFLTSKLPLRNEKNEVTGLIGLSYNITYRKEAEERLRKFSILESKSKEMEEFTYIASHDLREPLLTIKNYIALLIEDYGQEMPEEAQRFANSISRATVRMDGLITGLLDYSRLSRPKELESVDCNVILREVQDDLNSLITSTNAVLKIELLPVIKAYPLELKLLFQNLIQNAIKFRRKDVIPIIKISYQKIKEGWEFSVNDNGIGIAEADQKKIFSIFKRLHTSEEYAGTGIGLAHCKKITELHNGNIWVESEVGKFSSFYFSILTE